MLRTAAAKMTPLVPPDVIRDRARLLNDLDKHLQEKFCRQFIGQTVHVILENETPPFGRCERYFMVETDHANLPAGLKKGQVVEVLLRR